MLARLLLVLLLPAIAIAQNPYQEDLEADSQEHMREELGINEITAPSIRSLLQDLGNYQPVPVEVILADLQDRSFSNRLQTAMHFGSLVADGFMMTIAERPIDVQEIGKALIRQSRALGVGDRLTSRSKSLLEFSDKGDWIGMREELIKTQTDVENSMMELRDEEMAHMISLGGWIRGFQLSTYATLANYSPSKAQGLVRPEIIDYFIDRLETLHPRLKKTELVAFMTTRMKELKTKSEELRGRTPTREDIQEMQTLANEIQAAITSKVDEEGRIQRPGA